MDSFHSLFEARLLLSNDNNHNQRITKSSNDSLMNDDDDDGYDDGSGDYGIGGSIDSIVDDNGCGSCNGNSRCHKFSFTTPSKKLRAKCSKTIFWQFLVTVIYTLLYFSPSTCLAARQEATNCTFPQRWEGSWFLSGNQQPVFIKGSTLSFRGKCVASDGDKFLIVDDKGCHRCLVIYEKHKNVLQYKESECEGDNMYMDQSNPAAMPVQQLRILKSDHRGGAHPNTNGHSRISTSDQFPMRSNDDSNDCPSDYCKGRETLQNLCEQIAGDALLYSLFKENAEPVKCPLRGPFTFTYNRGHGECKNPVSNIDSCTEDSRLLLSFQACPDVSGTESTVEELTCLAAWKDGNSRYLVGLVSHHHAVSNEERYRCFVYEKISSLGGSSKDAEYKLAQSGDATCNGLDSAEVGSRIMTLRKAPPAERCDFPTWFKGPRHWHALMNNAGYIFHPNDGSMHITKQSGFMETRALCEQINKQTATEMMAVVHYTTGCQSGFMCMMFYRRDTHVAEIQMGTPAGTVADACAMSNFDINKLSYITLLASNPESQECPLGGLYNLKGAIGPPYISSRHKRNHSNKMHNHHHHETGGHRRHSTLSFRNSEDFDHGSWHMQTRGIPTRNRRETSDEIVDHDNFKISPQSNDQRVERRNLRKRRDTKVVERALSVNTSVNDTQRSRRDVPGCVVNYNAQRQLLVGCTEPNVIEVRPQCSEDSDEEYNCHGSWTENSTVFIIAKHVGSQHGICITYRPLEGNSVRLVVGDGCHRGTLPPPDHHLTANLTVRGKCSDTNLSCPVSTSNWIVICILSLLLVFTNR
ncbi:uncharacterized protein LOC119069418 isoform X3 [Bradysia coprophila]|nr:uncharacterized protein LOC119069418 isoform X3 [Bradysia coprophila]